MQFTSWIRSRAFIGVAGASALLAVGSAAHASVVLTVSINGGPTLFVGDGSANDIDPLPGQIVYADFNSAQFTGSVHVTTSNSPGNATGGQLTLQSTLVAADGGQITVTAYDTGFTLPSPPTDKLFTSSTLTSVAGEVAVFQGLANSTTTGIKYLTGPSASNNASIPFTYSGSYTLDAVIRTTLPANDMINVGETVSVTPEPASMACTGIAMAALLVRRRRA